MLFAPVLTVPSSSNELSATSAGVHPLPSEQHYRFYALSFTPVCA
jgi:hypothetical protein